MPQNRAPPYGGQGTGQFAARATSPMPAPEPADHLSSSALEHADADPVVQRPLVVGARRDNNRMQLTNRDLSAAIRFITPTLRWSSTGAWPAGRRPDSPVMSLLMAARESLAGRAEAVMSVDAAVGAAVVAPCCCAAVVSAGLYWVRWRG